LAVSIFETIPSIPLHKVPPFSQNVKKVLRQTDVFIAYTNRSAEYLRQLSVAEEKIRVVYPGVDLQRFHPSKGQNHESIRILFVGGFAGEKGLMVLLKAFASLYVDEPEVELWVCTKPRNRRVEALIEVYSRKYPVKALGYVDYDRIPEIYRQCDVFCLPSFDKRRWGVRVWEEEFGFALVEAMASGLPIVATNCGAMPEIVGNENLVVPQKSVGALRWALCKLVEDEGYRFHLAKANRERAKKLFDIETQRSAVNEVLGELF
jgi:glycosyltransferase involved in cell wall biosynthesis